MSPREIFTLRDYLGPELKGRTISDARRAVSLTDVLEQTCVVGRFSELSSRSVLLAVSDQLISALAMTELDGVARRMLLCPPDLDADHIQTLIDDADIDAIVTDQPPRWAHFGVYQVVAVRAPERRGAKPKTERATEWLMPAPGTSGAPKIVSHTLEGLTGAIVADGPAYETSPVWASFHDIRRHRGLQIFLRAIIGGGSMVLTEPGEAIADHVARLNATGRHPRLRHAVALAQASDERGGLGLFPALHPLVRRDRRPGPPRWFAPDLSRRRDRSSRCVDRGRFCRQRRRVSLIRN